MRIPTAFLGMCLACNSSGSKTPGADPSTASPRGPGKAGLRAQADKVDPEPGAPEAHLGIAAPDVQMVLQNGQMLRLSELRGKNVVLFFYPMDDTPGCRAEAQGFRDRFGLFQQANTTVLGVSLQGKESHQAFIDKERLPFDLVVDADAKVSEAFGVPIHGQVAARQTFLVDEAGVVAHVWRSVSPAQHPEEVLALVRK